MSPGAPGQGTDGGVARRGLVSHPGGDKPDRQTDIIKHTYIHTLQTYMHTIHTYTTNIHTLQTYIHYKHTYTQYIHTLQTYMHTIHTYTTNIHTLQTYMHTIHTYTTNIHTLQTYIHYKHTYTQYIHYILLPLSGHAHLAEPGCLCTKEALGACASKLLENGQEDKLYMGTQVPPGPLLLSEKEICTSAYARYPFTAGWTGGGGGRQRKKIG